MEYSLTLQDFSQSWWLLNLEEEPTVCPCKLTVAHRDQDAVKWILTSLLRVIYSFAEARVSSVSKVSNVSYLGWVCLQRPITKAMGFIKI